MKEVVWILGTSATGKETFIRNAHDNADLLRILAWVGKVLTFSEASVNNIGQYDNDPITFEREKIITEVPMLLNDADIVLVKWQIVDTDASRPQRLKSLLPNVRHRIIELTAPQDELIERIKQKPWWHNDGAEIELINKELGLVAEAMKQLNGDFESTTLTSSANTYTARTNE